MIQNFSLQKATQSDGPAIHQLVANALGEKGLYARRPKYVDADIDDLEANYFGCHGYFWVWKTEDGEIIASVAIARVDDTICELRKMYLSRQERGKGIGKMLLETAIEKAKELGYSTMILKTNSKLDTAIDVYRKYGFEHIPITESDKKADCDVAMQLELEA